MIDPLGGGIVGAGLAAAGVGIAVGAKSIGHGLKKLFSDRRLKENIHQVEGRRFGKYNLPVYRWKWKPTSLGLHGTQQGVMADDAKQVCPAGRPPDARPYRAGLGPGVNGSGSNAP